jgi:hypothetical protein
MPTFAEGDTSLHRHVLIQLSIGTEQNFLNYYTLCDKDAYISRLLPATKYNCDSRRYPMRVSNTEFFKTHIRVKRLQLFR